MTGRERVIAMIEGREVDHLPLMPITMMFAAAQIGEPYKEYVTDHRVLAEAQIFTAKKFGFDYVSVISDPAREATDLGAAIEWFDDQPPAINEQKALLTDKSVLEQMSIPDPLASGRMHDRVKGVALLKEKVGDELLVEGWVEGPCAMAADLRGINHLMLDFHDDPEFVAELFDFVINMELRFALAQVDAGADIIGVGDAASSLIGPRVYADCAWAAQKRLIDGLHALGTRVRLHICGRTRKMFPGMGKLGAEIVDLDYVAPLAQAREEMGSEQVLLGNVEPVGVLRNGTPELVRATVEACHSDAGRRYIAGAGCEVVRDTAEANLRALCEYAHSRKP
jgi:MtaA/CmuA family methyltransferase